MNHMISSIWQKPLSDTLTERMHDILGTASGRDIPLQVFFRADDIAHVDEPFRQLMHTFLTHATPLCLAVVPEWLDDKSWSAMQEFDPGNSLWCWHQHGRSHTNHQREGKKGEFGEQRSREEIRTDLLIGRNILLNHFGELFYPVFTPPWNRCSLTTLELLHEFGYKAVSRSTGAKPFAAHILPDLAINIDLHTRREIDFNVGWEKLLAEFGAAADNGYMGIMLHHQLMNENAFTFLDMLLGMLTSQDKISCVTFKELV